MKKLMILAVLLALAMSGVTVSAFESPIPDPTPVPDRPSINDPPIIETPGLHVPGPARNINEVERETIDEKREKRERGTIYNPEGTWWPMPWW